MKRLACALLAILTGACAHGRKACEGQPQRLSVFSAAPASAGPESRLFGGDDLYRNGAKVGKVYAPGEAPRELSLKVYSFRGPNGKLGNQIWVADVTDPRAPSAPVLVPSAPAAAREFSFQPCGPRYVMEVSADRGDLRVLIHRAGVRWGEGGARFPRSMRSSLAPGWTKRPALMWCPSPDATIMPSARGA